MSGATVDVDAMVAELIEVLGEEGLEERVKALIGGQDVAAWRGCEADKLKEFLISRCYAIALVTPLAYQFNPKEALRLCGFRGLQGEVGDGTQALVVRWLRAHGVPELEPVGCANLVIVALPEIGTSIDANWDKRDLVKGQLVIARERLEAFFKELLAFQWGLVGSLHPESLTDLAAHLSRYPEYYGTHFEVESGAKFAEWLAKCNLTMEPLLAITGQLQKSAARYPEVERSLRRYVCPDWCITGDELAAVREFRTAVDNSLHNRTTPPPPSRSEVAVCFSRLSNVLGAWRQRCILPVVARFKEVVENRWGLVVTMFNLSYWDGSMDKPPKELRLFYGHRDRDRAMALMQATLPMYVYAANNPIAVDFEVHPRHPVFSPT
jgi:hypothetical protein